MQGPRRAALRECLGDCPHEDCGDHEDDGHDDDDDGDDDHFAPLTMLLSQNTIQLSNSWLGHLRDSIRNTVG